MATNQSTLSPQNARFRRVLMFNISPWLADFLYDVFTAVLVLGTLTVWVGVIWPIAAVTFVGAFTVTVGTYGSIKFGSVKEYFANERISANELATEQAKADSEIAKLAAAEATERAANTDLARVELEARLLPRMLNQEQWDFIQGLRGKFAQVSIAFETDAETRWFAGQIRDAFFSAGISVAMYPRAAEVHSFGTFIFEPKGFDGSRPRTVEPLVEIFGKMELIGSLAVITEVPTDVLLSIESTRSEMRAPLDTPMIIVGGRFVIPPPHLERAAKAAKAARDAMVIPNARQEVAARRL